MVPSYSHLPWTSDLRARGYDDQPWYHCLSASDPIELPLRSMDEA
jgi:hypothetical protein